MNNDPPAADLWDSELIVLEGHDRASLLRRIGEFREFVSKHPDISLTELAITTNATLSSEKRIRVGLVAESFEQLVRHLDRALVKIANPKCTRIREVSGLYFVAEPIYSPGSLAFVCPGEGSQYPGMLAGLRESFAAIEVVHQRCSVLASAEDGPGIGLLDRLFTAADEGKNTSAWASMAGDFSTDLFSVVIGNWVYSEIAAYFSLTPDFVAGHSAGEMSALCMAGAISDDDVVGLAKCIYDMSSGVDKDSASLLALGTSREKAEAIVAEANVPPTASGQAAAYVAMDNCPHQSVIVGLPDAVEQIESTLKQKSVIYERLELDRPYHTELFEPYMKPVRDMFVDVHFKAPKYSVYSCTTAKPFPDDRNATRSLSIDHWVSTVEFVKLIRQMYDDGARVFIEVGPRGNLTSFIEDTLRGKPFVAVPLNVPRVSCLTQLHHALARLIVHGVPVALDQHYTNRHALPDGTAAVDEQAVKPNQAVAALSPVPVTEQIAPSGQFSQRGGVMQQYQTVMQQFLEVQQGVMQAFLTGPNGNGRRTARRPSRRAGSRTSRGTGPSSRSRRLNHTVAAEQSRTNGESPVVADAAPVTPAVVTDFPLLTKASEHDATRLRIRRTLDLAAEPYADHHTVGGQHVSRVDPDQHGLPVMPMTFTLETLAEAASKLVPGMTVVSLREVRLQKWLAFYVEDPVSIELLAERLPHNEVPRPIRRTLDPDNVVVRVSIRDLGNSGIGPGAQGGDAVSGLVVLAKDFPPPGPEKVADFELSNPRPFNTTWTDLYDNLFHGPFFQGIVSLDQYGDRQVVGTIEVLPRVGLLTGNDTPQFIQDPVTMDTAMHTLAAWHVEQTDQNGRIMLPFSLDRVDFFAPCPGVGERFRCHGQLRKETPRYVVQDLDVFDANGRLRWQMKGIRLWRFYLPFDGVNFHGPKDVYFLSGEWPEAAPNDATTCVRFDAPDDLLQPAILWAASKVALTPREQKTFIGMQGAEYENAQWVLSRGACKDATRKLFLKRENLKMFPADIEIDDSTDGRWRTYARCSESVTEFPRVAFAEVERQFVALATPDGTPFVAAAAGDVGNVSANKSVVEQLAQKVSPFFSIERIDEGTTPEAPVFCFSDGRSAAVTVAVSEGLVVATCVVPE